MEGIGGVDKMREEVGREINVAIDFQSNVKKFIDF
jgi:hypothetical protein